jgi:hypothetical protein
VRTFNLILNLVFFTWDVRPSFTLLKKKKLQVKLDFTDSSGFHGEDLNCGLLGSSLISGYGYPILSPLWLYSPSQTLAASMKLSISLQLLDLGQSVGLIGRVIRLSQGLYLDINTEKPYTHTNTKTSMPCVGFEPTVPASARVKTVHTLDRSTTVTGRLPDYTV